MKFSTASVILAFISGLSLVAGEQKPLSTSSHSHAGRKCGSEIAAARKAAHKHASAKAVSHPEINVNFHVIAAHQTRASGGWIPNTLQAREHYSHSQQRLVYGSVPRQRVPNHDEVLTAQRRRSRVEALNVYTVRFENPRANGLFGHSTFPADYEGLPRDDGVVI